MKLIAFFSGSSLAALAFVALAGTAAHAQQTPESLAAMATKASTRTEHATVAKHYRLQAQAFEEEAAAHEKRAAQYAASAPPIVHKWPSMAPRAHGESKQKAIAARRAALESYQLAQRHINLSVEAQSSAD
jgi:hypothetical protein